MPITPTCGLVPRQYMVLSRCTARALPDVVLNKRMSITIAALRNVTTDWAPLTIQVTSLFASTSQLYPADSTSAGAETESISHWQRVYYCGCRRVPRVSFNLPAAGTAGRCITCHSAFFSVGGLRGFGC